MDLIIFAHPDPTGSHNAQVLQFVRDTLVAQGRPFEVIDLHKDGFSPIMNAEEVLSFGKESADGQVNHYRQQVHSAQRLIFIYPIWWYGPPAILKGFFDRVFGAGFAYQFRRMHPMLEAMRPAANWAARIGAVHPLLHYHLPVIRHLSGKKAVVVSTFGGDESGHRLFGRAAEKSVDEVVLRFCGIADIRRVNWFNARKPGIPPDVQKKIIAALD